MTTPDTTPTPTEVEELAREVRLQAWLSNPRQFATWILTRFVRREEHERLCAEVREWLCETCRFVYPGPPMPGLRCVVCPQCSGPTAPRHTVEMRELRAELKGQRCDGSGELTVMGWNARTFKAPCQPRCPACKPDATPPNIGYRRCCGSDQDKSHEEWCDNKPTTIPKGDECPHEAWETARGGFGRKCADCGQWLSDDGDRTRESVSEAGGVHDDSPVQSAAPVLVTADDFSGWNHGGMEYESRILQNQYLIGKLLIEQRDAAPVSQVLTVELGPETLRALATLMTDRGGEKLLAMLGEVKP